MTGNVSTLCMKWPLAEPDIVSQRHLRSWAVIHDNTMVSQMFKYHVQDIIYLHYFDMKFTPELAAVYLWLGFLVDTIVMYSFY